jgi:hypothetical protein
MAAERGEIDAKFWRDVVSSGIGIAPVDQAGVLSRISPSEFLIPPALGAASNIKPPKRLSPYNDMQKLHMRMDVPQGEMLFDTVAVHRTPSKVHLFIGNKENVIVMEDDPVLFPSDTLIARIRLLEW